MPKVLRQDCETAKLLLAQQLPAQQSAPSLSTFRQRLKTFRDEFTLEVPIGITV